MHFKQRGTLNGHHASGGTLNCACYIGYEYVWGLEFWILLFGVWGKSGFFGGGGVGGGGGGGGVYWPLTIVLGLSKFLVFFGGM